MFFGVSDKCTLPFGRDLLIKAARQRARGISWEVIAKDTPHSAGELCRFAVKHPEVWRPLYVRAEKLRLQEAEGQTLAHFTALLKGDDEQAAEKAGRELLLHRRHIQRRRLGSGTRDQGPGSVGGAPSPQSLVPGPSPAEGASQYPQWLVQEPAPEELEIALLAAARGVALGEMPGSIARETGHDAEEIARWAFVYAKAWDRAWRPACLEAAEFCAALAINRLLDLIAGPDAKLAARAGRTLLIHRRHMHWARQRSYQPQRPQRPRLRRGYAGQAQRTEPGSRVEGTGSAGSPAADSLDTPLRLSAPSAVKRFLPRARDGPGR